MELISNIGKLNIFYSNQSKKFDQIYSRNLVFRQENYPSSRIRENNGGKSPTPTTTTTASDHPMGGKVSPVLTFHHRALFVMFVFEFRIGKIVLCLILRNEFLYSGCLEVFKIIIYLINFPFFNEV